MSAASEIQLRLTAEEARELLSVLEQDLRRTELEVHRTDSLSYKELVKHDEDLLRGIVNRLRGN
jgi:hypothetical protein